MLCLVMLALFALSGYQQSLHIEDETKWLPFPRRHFQMHLVERKCTNFLLRFYWSLFQRAWWTIFQHWFKEWLGAGEATSHCLNQWWLIYWRTHASLNLNVLISNGPYPFIHCEGIWMTHTVTKLKKTKTITNKNICSCVREKWRTQRLEW